MTFTIKTLIAGSAAMMLSTAAFAQDYPTGSVSLVVPFSAGGTTDAIARLVAEELQKRWGEAVVVENKPGAGGVIATNSVANSRADGSQILFTDIGIALNEVTMPSLPYSLEEDLRPVAAVGEWPLAFLAASSTGITTLSELVERSKEERLSFGTFGPASSPHLGVELFKSLTDAPLQVVHFQGVSPVIQAMSSGEVQLGIFGVGAAAAEVAKGSMNVLALDYTSPLMPEAPTFAEAGFEGMRSIAWWGAFMPAETDDAIVAEVNAAINEALTAETVVTYLETNGYTAVGGEPEALQQRVTEAVALWGPIVEAAGIQTQ